MPIKIKVNSNSSSIRTHVTNESKEVVTKKDNLSTIHTDIKSSNNVPVHTVNDSDEVRMKSGCDVTGKKLELEIKDEARTRAAADEKLEQQIHDIIISGVNVDNTTIVLNKDDEISVNPELLETIDNKIEDVQDSVDEVKEDLNTLDTKIDKVEDDVEGLEGDLNNHIHNTNIHVTVNEKNYWNSKMSVSVEDDPDSDDLMLVFKK